MSTERKSDLVAAALLKKSIIMSAVASSFDSVQHKFGSYHQSSGNVNAHIATSLLGFVGFGCLLTRICVSLRLGRIFPFAIWFVYAATLVALPNALQCVCACVFIAVVSAKLDLGWASSLAAVAAGYALQDAAHWYYGEETYQQNSWGGKNGTFDLFMEHCYFLLPLTFSCASSGALAVVSLLPLAALSWANFAIDSDSFGPIFSSKKRLLVGKFAAPSEVRDLASCRSWCAAKKPSKSTTSHWWLDDLDDSTRAAFLRLVESDTIKNLFASKFRSEQYRVEPVLGMNELYVSASLRKGPKNSDDVFFTEHVDGPFCFFPFASVYRCIVALDANAPGFTTHFPNAAQSKTAKNGDILAFDFHRETHYITQDGEGDSDDYRIVLKLHYVAAPRGPLFWIFGNALRTLSVMYNQLFRKLFLATISPTSRLATITADLGVVGFTVLYNSIEKFVGFANLTYYVAVAAIAYSTGSYNVFLYATQYLHYLRYMYTYYDREGVAYGSFKRDALLYKSIALAQLFFIYAAPKLGLLESSRDETLFGPDLILVVAGYAVSTAATVALGVDGTYFGIELGHVKADYRFVTQFPYNCIPHPMILGQCVAILGLHLGSSYMRTNYPLLAPIHILLYLVHMTQEAFDFHTGEPWYSKKKAPAAASSSSVEDNKKRV